jgi:hypothetical protein
MDTVGCGNSLLEQGNLKMIKRLLFLVMMLLLPLPLQAQGRWQVGPHILVSIPRQEFENVSGVGGGFGVKGLYELSDNFTLRGDFAYLSYGKEFENLNQLDPFTGFPLVAEDQRQAFRLSVGPQGLIGGDVFSIYASLQGGVYFYRINRIIPTFTYNYSESKNNNFALGWNGGLGFQFDIGLGPWIDICAEYQTMYNLPGKLIESDDPEEPPTRGPDITAHEITLKFGVIFFLGDD